LLDWRDRETTSLSIKKSKESVSKKKKKLRVSPNIFISTIATTHTKKRFGLLVAPRGRFQGQPNPNSQSALLPPSPVTVVGRCRRRRPLLYPAIAPPRRGWWAGGGARWQPILDGGAVWRHSGGGSSARVAGGIVAAPERRGSVEVAARTRWPISGPVGPSRLKRVSIFTATTHLEWL
jgi:hypothetical protein